MVLKLRADGAGVPIFADARSIHSQIQQFCILEILNPGIQEAGGRFFDSEDHGQTDTFELFPLVWSWCFEYVTYSYCELLLSDYLP